jgi:hypothetical protein
MTTITIKVNERTKVGKAFLEMTNALVNDSKGIEIIETDSNKVAESLYDPEFVKMIQKRFADIKRGKSKTITLDPNDVWGSLGLK